LLLVIELGLTLLALAAALIAPRLGSRGFEALEKGWSRLSYRRWVAVASIGVSALVLRLALLPVIPVPKPFYHDDFCYLLAADTFAHGRLANPTHRMWVHFESFGIIHNPSYQCIAQPAQGLILAFGKVALGNPFWGVWLSVGLMCASICWMLQAWVPSRWALLGGMIAALRFGTFGYWANSYWGGALGATGGALLLGALPRIKRSQRIRDALLLALGLAILANSRPYEGLVLSVPVAVSLFTWMFGKGHPPVSTSFRRVIVPLAASMLLVGSSMATYNWRVTGIPYRMAYQLEREAYGVPAYFVWQSLSPPPVYRHEMIRAMYANSLEVYGLARSPAGVMMKTLQVWAFYVGPVATLTLVLALLTLPYGFRWHHLRNQTRFLLLAFVFCALGLFGEVFFEAHYAAPITSLILAIVLLSMRHLRSWQVGDNPTGRLLVRAIPVIFVSMFILRVVANPLHIWLPGATDPAWFEALPMSKGRPSIVAQLQQLPGQHLVIVHYKPDRRPIEEWVYNDADIDASKVIWAREMSPEQNEELIRYFKDRKVWLVAADEDPPRILPYDQTSEIPIQATSRSKTDRQVSR
jgi:hypothetical protein